MAIIGTLPVTLQNGTTADASQVMTDLNYIANQVNANAMAASNQTFSAMTVEGGALAVDGAAGTNRRLLFQTGGLNRWIVEADSTAEGGSTTGSNFEIISCTDAGGTGSSAMTITRATNAVVFSGTLSAANLTGSSDRRLKSRIKRIRNATEVVLSWIGVTFQRKGDKTKRRHAGFIANDFEASAPELVYEDENGVKSIAYGNTSAYLAEAFKELEARVRKLEGGQ